MTYHIADEQQLRQYDIEAQRDQVEASMHRAELDKGLMSRVPAA